MKVLVYSPAFLPGIGGLEINVARTAAALVRHGFEVVVVTTTANTIPNEKADAFPFRVVRRPGPAELLRWVRWCDLFYQANVSLRGLWPLLLARRPWVVSHHSWYCRPDGRVAWADRLKRRLLRHAAASISVSRAMAADLDTPSTVIPNAYRDDLFRVLPGVGRTRDLIFLGRLVSDKGVEILIEALSRLAAEGLAPRLTVVGEGPERARLEAQAAGLGLADRVDFLGLRTGEELVRLLNEHRILVVPSRYNEPFGIVALEGIACGCVVVGSSGGGLPEAIGPCGLTFPNGDAAALANILAGLLRDPQAGDDLTRHAAAHLALHREARVGAAYAGVLTHALKGARR
jgi:glycosyltransferase involved in cell wall biosynthesis